MPSVIFDGETVSGSCRSTGSTSSPSSFHMGDHHSGDPENPDETPKAIFVSAIDTAPLAADQEYLLTNHHENFQRGINVLKKLVDQAVFLGVDASHTAPFDHVENVQMYTVS